MIYTIVRKTQDDKIDAVISFDSISSMDETRSATVTSQTVEYGFNITDNINIEAPTFNIAAVVSSYSLFATDRELVWSGEDFSSNYNSVNRYSHAEARDRIIKVFEDRSLVTLIESSSNSNNENLDQVVTELKSGYHKEIEPCIITSLSISHPSEGHGAFLINMTLQKINMAKIAVSELEEGEKRAAIKRLAISFDKSGSKQSKEEGYIDPATGEPVESTINNPKGNYEEMRKIKDEQYGLTKTKDREKAVEIATHEMERNGTTHTVVPRGDSLAVIEGSNKAALMNPTGVVAVVGGGN